VIANTEHKPAPSTIIIDGTKWPKSALLAREDWKKLAQAGYYRHVPYTESAPLGSTWQERSDAKGVYYEQIPNGTEAEREAAALQQWRETAFVARVYAELTLIQSGLWAAVQAFFESPERTDAERAWWRATPTWRRTHAAMESAATALGLTAEQIDDLFRSAITLQSQDQ